MRYASNILKKWWRGIIKEAEEALNYSDYSHLQSEEDHHDGSRVHDNPLGDEMG